MLALVHDMAESLVGDITPVDGVPKAEKNRREAVTMDYLCGELLGGVDSGTAGKQIREAWQEYEDGKTPESRFVHDVDKVELLLQMLDYEKATQGERDLSEFAYVADKIEYEEVKQWCKQLLKERDAYWKSIGKENLSQKNRKEGKDDVPNRDEMDEYYERNKV
jgi:putative hydrolase of HD superfamily